jgi:hypothetical protein
MAAFEAARFNRSRTSPRQMYRIVGLYPRGAGCRSLVSILAVVDSAIIGFQDAWRERTRAAPSRIALPEQPG